MTGFTGHRRRLVEENVFTLNFLLEFVTVRAWNALVTTLQREGCLFVIEERRLPLIAVMTRRAVVLLIGKLLAMRIFVALTTFLRSLGEIYMEHGALHVGRLVTIGAFHGAMRANEREFGVGMVESGQVLPFFCGVARFAAKRIALGILPGHALGKFAVMNIFVACGAGELR